jgi:CheY-like chemotaxis protein
MSKPRILIVDDEPDVVTMMQRTLDTEGFEVLSAYDGLAALDIAETEQPDVILLDIMMPMMSGYETCAQLMQNPATKDIPVLCLTSASNIEVKDKARKAGAQGLLNKPILPRELAVQLQRYIKT